MPDLIAIDGRSKLVRLADHSAIAPDEGVDKDSAAAATDIYDVLLDRNRTRLTHVQENIDDENSALNIDYRPYIQSVLRSTLDPEISNILSKHEGIPQTHPKRACSAYFKRRSSCPVRKPNCEQEGLELDQEERDALMGWRSIWAPFKALD